MVVRKVPVRALLALAALAVAPLVGCEMLARPDRSLVGQNGSGGGGGGGGAGNGGTGGVGGSPECAVAADCPDPMNECVERTCEGGACGTANVPDGTELAAQTAQDCRTVVCNGNGGKIAIADPADVEDDMNPCTNDVCTGVIPEHPNMTAGAACSQGGVVCDGSGHCVACNVAADCQGGQVCNSMHQCVPATCNDGAQNGDETGVDCGGSCPGCVGDACAAPADCQSTFCADGVCCDSACAGLCDACTQALKGSGQDGACGPTATGIVCAAQTCAGGVQENEDTCDGAGACVDNGTTSCSPYVCGGTTCKTSCVNSMDCLAGSGTYCSMMQCVPKKADGQPCMGNNQCQNNVCKLGVCRPAQCGNMMQDGDETDLDCGGVCGATCATGQGCMAVADCAPSNTQCTGSPATCQP